MSRRVPGPRAAALTYRVLVSQLLTRGRVIGLAMIGAGVVLLGWVVGNVDRGELAPAERAEEQLEAGVGLISLVGFTALVPVVALVFAAASLGDTREDGTLVYLWLRPMPRWAVAVGAWSAALTVALPLTVVPITVTAVLLDAGGDLVVAAALASLVAVIAYSGVFVLLGLLVKNAIVWGLAYVILWEGVVAAFGSAAARVAIRGYASSILTDRTGVSLDLGDVSQLAAVVVTLAVAVVALVLASARLQRLEVA
jgi:ABC-2 type transport system permease protein